MKVNVVSYLEKEMLESNKNVTSNTCTFILLSFRNVSDIKYQYLAKVTSSDLV